MAASASGRASVLIDTSVLLAILRAETGHETAVTLSAGGSISTVHSSEALSKASDRGVAASDALALVAELDLTPLPFDEADALAAASLRPMTMGKDVSFADRACLGAAGRRGLTALSSDHRWAELGLDVRLRLFRDKR